MHPSGSDSQLAKRLRRDAVAAAKAQARVQEAHARAVRRREHRIAAARRWLPAQAGVTAVSAAAAAQTEASLVFGTVGVLAGVAAVRSLSRLFRPPPPPVPALPAAPAVPMPPPPRSAAFPAVRRLEVVREELRRLVPLVAPAGREAAEDAWRAASEADTALRWQAARLAAVEPHRGVDAHLLRTLEDGVRCQERVVTAMADLVAASADPLAASRLQDVTDALHGLAAGLREVR